MTARGVLALAMLALVTSPTAAQEAAKPSPFKATDYPIEVRKSLSNAVLVCRQEENGKVTFASDTVRKIDLNGDGRDDYLVSLADTKCSTFESIFCGTGGCDLDIYVALANGAYRLVFSNRVRGYEILPGKGARTIRFDMHGGYCGTYGAAECVKQKRITDKPFAYRDR